MTQRIPITMCHGTGTGAQFPLNRDHFDGLVAIARELGFESIDYDRLADWRDHGAAIPERAIMFDFDHAVKSIGTDVREVLDSHGYTGTLFINTGPMAPLCGAVPASWPKEWLSWDAVNGLIAAGWHIGAHTVTHPNLSELFAVDPTGERLQAELVDCDATIEQYTGVKPRDFAFTGTSWSSMAEKLVMQRYRFGRLWIVRNTYQADGREVRYADLVGVEGPDEADGGPPMAARYITRSSHPYRLPSMEFQCALMNRPEQFRSYLEGALGG